MKYRTMGSLPWEVSALGFGCMRLPTAGLIPRVNESYTIEIIRYGIDRGINYVDTAWFYHLGQSEKILGEALKDGYREKVHLTTKLPMVLVRKEDDFDRFLDAQLERLQTGRIDVYLFHMLNQANFALLNNKSFGSTGKIAGRVIQWLVSRNYKRLEKQRRQPVAQDTRGRASLCVGCNACVPKCPQHIAIPDELKKVVAVFEKRKPIKMFRPSSEGRG